MTEISSQIVRERDRPAVRDSTTSPFDAPNCHRPDERDDRFRQLTGLKDWANLPDAVQSRFSRHLAPGHARLFQGRVIETRLSLAGRWLAWATKAVGGPLPDTDGATGAASVLVVEEPRLGGQIWTRIYARPGQLPQTINSVKRFSGPTGLEECLGYGLVMRLTLTAEGRDLVFQSAGYAIELGMWRLPVPRWLSPGVCTITHRARGSERFDFILALDHPWLGRLAYQVAEFEEV